MLSKFGAICFSPAKRSFTTKQPPTKSNFTTIFINKSGHSQLLVKDIKAQYGSNVKKTHQGTSYTEVISSTLISDTSWCVQSIPDVKKFTIQSESSAISVVSDFIGSELVRMTRLKDSPRDNIRWTFHILESNGAPWQGKMTKLGKQISSHLSKHKVSSRYTAPIKEIHFTEKCINLKEKDVIVQAFLPEIDKLAISIQPISFDFFWNRPLPYSTKTVSSFPRAKDYPAQSIFKAAEVLLQLGLYHGSGLAGKLVADLGSAPGGWSTLFLECGAIVTSVDLAGVTYKPILENTNFTHLVSDAAVFSPVEAGILSPFQQFDYTFADMAIPPYTSIKILEKWILAGWTKAFCWTLKFGFHPNLEYHVVLQESRSMLKNYPHIKYSIRHLTKHENELIILGRIDPVIPTSV